MADPAPPAFSPVTAPPPASPTARPGLVTAAGVIGIVEGAFACLGGLIVVLLGGAIAKALSAYLPGIAGVGGAFLAVVGVLVLVFGVLFILLGLQVLKGRNWARITMIVLAALGALGSLRGGLLSAAVDIFVIVALLLPQSAAWFDAMEGRARAA